MTRQQEQAHGFHPFQASKPRYDDMIRLPLIKSQERIIVGIRFDQWLIVQRKCQI